MAGIDWGIRTYLAAVTSLTPADCVMSRVKPAGEEAEDARLEAARRKAERYFAPPHRRRLLRNDVKLTSGGGCFLNGRGWTSAKVKGIPAAAINLLKIKSAHVRRIHNCFLRIDEDGSGGINVSNSSYHGISPSSIVLLFGHCDDAHRLSS